VRPDLLAQGIWDEAGPRLNAEFYEAPGVLNVNSLVMRDGGASVFDYSYTGEGTWTGRMVDMAWLTPKSDCTVSIQRALNRLRIRAHIFGTETSVFRYFRPDVDQIASDSGVPYSSVRRLFEGAVINDEAQRRILDLLGQQNVGAVWVPPKKRSKLISK